MAASLKTRTNNYIMYMWSSIHKHGTGLSLVETKALQDQDIKGLHL